MDGSQESEVSIRIKMQCMSAADIASQNLYLEKCKPPIQKQLAKQLRLDTIKWAYFTSIGRIFVTKGHIVGFILPD